MAGLGQGFQRGLESLSRVNEYNALQERQARQDERQVAMDAKADELRGLQMRGLQRQENKALKDDQQKDTMTDLSSGMASQGDAYNQSLQRQVLANQAGVDGNFEMQGQLQKMAETIKAEGASDTLGFIEANNFAEATKAYNSSGAGRTGGFEPNPADKTGATFINRTPEGEAVVMSKARIRELLADPQQLMEKIVAKEAADLKRGQALGDEESKRTFELKKLNTEYGLKGGLEKTKAAAEAGVGGMGKPTNAQKQYQELVAMGVPHQQAQGISYGAFKAMTDPGSGAMVLYDVANGQEVGRMMSDNPGAFDSKKRFVPIGQQPKISHKDATTQAQQMAKDKAQMWNLDSTDFGPEGREAWIKNTAAELMRNSTDDARAGGGLPVQQPKQIQAPLRGAGLRPLSTTAPQVPTAAVEMLRKNPSLAPQFEQKYGVGAKDYLR